jgi:hypothetical protein
MKKLNYDKIRYNEMLAYCQKFNEHNNNMIESDIYSKDYSNKLFELFYDEFAKVEINNESDYFLSNIYCDRVFNETLIENETTIDGILYPSVSFGYQEQNLVLHPRVMNKIQFVDASFVKVIYYSENEFVDFKTIEGNVKPDNDGLLNWKYSKLHS